MIGSTPVGGILDDRGRLARACVDLTRQIDRGAVVLSSRLAEAFLNTARHPYVPTFYRRDADTFVPWSAADAGTESDTWLAHVYSDESLITEVDGIHAETAGLEPRRGVPTSSSTAPSLMADMLDALDLHPGHRVLEIGTGSGYNAALLCYLVGDSGVVTVDATPHLVETARSRLRSQGLAPTVRLGDGALGCPEHAPYDRIIATCSVSRIPQAWLDQCVDDGILVVPIKGSLAGGSIARCTKLSRHSASGHLLHTPAAFMPLRTGDEASLPAVDITLGFVRQSGVSGRVLDDWTFSFFGQLHLPPGAVREFWTADGRHTTILFDPADGSGARIHDQHDGSSQLTVTGPRDLWAPVEEAHRQWLAWHRPRREWFTVGANPAGQFIRFTAPDGTEHNWAL